MKNFSEINRALVAKKKIFLFMALCLISVLAAQAEPIVRVVGGAEDKAFASGSVHKLVLTSTSIDVVNNEGAVLLSVPVSQTLRVEFTDGTPTAVEATILKDDEAVKIIEHGQVYILRSGKKYTIMGVEVEHKY
jgi:hypothetical protein